jgi:hypothetical protein
VTTSLNNNTWSIGLEPSVPLYGGVIRANIDDQRSLRPLVVQYRSAVPAVREVYEALVNLTAARQADLAQQTAIAALSPIATGNGLASLTEIAEDARCTPWPLENHHPAKERYVPPGWRRTAPGRLDRTGQHPNQPVLTLRLP